MDKEMPQMELQPALGDEPLPEGSKGAVPINTVDEMREQMKQFTDSVHAKASQVVQWQNTLENVVTDRAAKFLQEFKNYSRMFSLYYGLEFKTKMLSVHIAIPLSLTLPRFMEESKTIMTDLEASFEKLAEAMHAMDLKQPFEKYLGYNCHEFNTFIKN